MKLTKTAVLSIGSLLAYTLCSTFADETSETSSKYIPGSPLKTDFHKFSQDFVEFYCFDCHGDGMDKGNFSLDNLKAPDETNTEIWKSIWAQVAIGEMPPKKEDQPSTLEKVQFTDGVIEQLQTVMKHKGGFHDHLSSSKGNFIAHELLFGELPEEIKLIPTSSPKRIWRLTPLEHLTRLNELINTEPKYDPKKPGYRTHGDAVSVNHGGELKLYYGVDRITNWSGGDVSYMTALMSTPGVLTSKHKYGFENYPNEYSVNSSETLQILNKAKHILRYMAYGPGSLLKTPNQITEDPATYAENREKTDDRGLPSSLTYNTKFIRPKTALYEMLKDGDNKYTRAKLKEVIAELYESLTFQPATEQDIQKYFDLTEGTIKKLGTTEGLFTGLSAIFLDRDALFRPELTEHDKADKHGRYMLQNWELGLALNHSLSYIKPDPQLREAIISGKMKTREDVQRELTRMLEDDSIKKPRVLQFFREYFDYDLAGYNCKDEEAMQHVGVVHRNRHYTKAMFGASASTDRLVEMILADDKEVLKNLLTTQQVVVSEEDTIFYGRMRSPEEIAAAEDETQQMKNTIAQAVREDAKMKTVIKEVSEKLRQSGLSKAQRLEIQRELINSRHHSQQLSSDKNDIKLFLTPKIKKAHFEGEQVYARINRPTLAKKSMQPERLLSIAPKGQRLGILTTPSWLISHSDAMDNHAIHRGIWIRKRLLGGGIPEVPITVDAQLPDEPNTTLRSRMRVTQEKYCWSCHEKMDPLGLTFEMYNHMGIYRETEFGEPIDTSGAIIDSGDPELDGEVKGAFEMIHKLAENERVEQVFVRHAFRYWMGRNETIHDGPTLQAAHKAYRDNGGSMKALIISLVTSDAFLYRK